MTKQTVNLGSVQETLLIPLFSRALETARPNGLLKDTRAEEIVDQLEYDFSKWPPSSSWSQACIRTRLFDDIALDFLAQHPDGVIVEIGCGLNTRFERIDNGQATWFDLDLPDSIELRRVFFEDTPRRTMIAGSVFDEDWMEPVLKVGKPTLFLSEAVLIYFEEAEVKQAIVQIAEKFPGAGFATDICTSKLTTPKAQERGKRVLGISSWFKWACDDPKSIEAWYPGTEFVGSQTYVDASKDIIAKMPAIWRALTTIAPFFVRYLVKDYRIAHYRLGRS